MTKKKTKSENECEDQAVNLAVKGLRDKLNDIVRGMNIMLMQGHSVQFNIGKKNINEPMSPYELNSLSVSKEYVNEK